MLNRCQGTILVACWLGVRPKDAPGPTAGRFASAFAFRGWSRRR